MKGVLKFNELLAPYTSWHIGGPADQYYCPVNLEDLREFLSTLSDNEPITWLGLGSNVLIADEGIRGVVIHTLLQGARDNEEEYGKEKEEKKTGITLQLEKTPTAEKKILRVEAGVTCAKLAKFCAKHGLMGAEFFAGIPGTVGGALAMNAGAWGGETWQQVLSVEVINRHGDIIVRSADEYQIGYRMVKPPKVEEWFVAAHFQFACGEAEAATQKIKNLLRERKATQPIGVYSCGSVFKNPKGYYAGQLIESAHLKGFKIGEAQVSPKHANFILNLGHASAKDILQLIKHIQQVVLEIHHIALETEVRFLGFPDRT